MRRSPPFPATILVACALVAVSAAGPKAGEAPAPAAAPAAAAATAAAPIIERGHFDLARPEIRSFIDQMVEQGLGRAQLIAVLGAAEAQPKIIESMERPAEKTLAWWEYRTRMLTPLRIEGGAQLWREHRDLLEHISAEYQVPPEYILAVLGVETQYGRTTGRYRVLDALATLAFDYPPRAAFFRKELGEYLQLVREDGLDPLSVRGSYAGAMGALQFMPSSYRRYAVSGSHAAHRDLWNDWADIFASVANYLHQFGWQYGAPVLAEAQLGTTGAGPLVLPEKLALSETLGALRARGLVIDSSLPDSTPALLIGAAQPDAMGYRVGFQNFYVITRYNASPLYAMAVHDLAVAIRQQLGQEGAL